MNRPTEKQSMHIRVLRLAIPNIVSNITVPLLGMADIAVVGHLKGASTQIGAIAIGGMLFSFIYMTLSFLRASSAGLTAQAFGKKNKTEIQRIFIRAVAFALGLAIILISFQNVLSWIGFSILEAEPVVEFSAKAYFNVRIWAAPATLLLYVFNGWFIGMQNTKIPMIIAVAGNIINISLNYLMVFGFGMQAEGVALATVIAQYSSLLLSVLFMRLKYKSYTLGFPIKESLVWKQIKALLSLNRDLFIRSLILIFVLSFFTVISAKISTEVLAVNSLLFQFFLFFSFFMDGFAYAAEALTGKYFGQGRKLKLQQAVKTTFIWGFYLSVPFTLIYAFGQKSILYLLTDDTAIVNLAMDYQYWVVIIPLLSFVSFLWDGVYIGATAAKPIRNTMIVSGLLVFVPVFFLAAPALGNHGLWLAFTAFMLVRGSLMSFWYPSAVLKKVD
ncbi:MAG: MATE family efflux transporter [Bacteroidales bacterium]|nr:MATE family efflux transporter [Bacteroidales bacterium]